MAHSTDSPMASSTCFKGLGEPPGGPDNVAACSGFLLQGEDRVLAADASSDMQAASVHGIVPLSPAKKDGPESKW